MTGYAARAVLVLCLLLAGVSGVLAADSGPERGLESATFATSPVDADTVVFDVLLAEDGTATWQLSYRVELTTDNETAAFESLQSDIRTNTSSYLSAFEDRIGRTVGTAENATGREMTARNFSVSTRTEGLQNTGEVAYRFTWTNFSAVDGETIRAGDALSGFFLDADSRLRIAWPDAYQPTEYALEPDDEGGRFATWNGPVEFGSAGPAITVEPESGLPLVFVAVAAVVGIGLAGGALWLLNRDELTGDDEDEPTETTADPEPDEELLSNEERVMRLLEERGGRVKQQAVATEFDWTDAKTSQVVGTLRDEERVDVFRLGRENVLVLPEENDL